MALKFERPPFANIRAIQNWKAFNDVWDWGGDGAPIDGVTGKGVLGAGSTYMDTSKGFLYSNTGTVDNPVWTRT